MSIVIITKKLSRSPSSLPGSRMHKNRAFAVSPAGFFQITGVKGVADIKDYFFILGVSSGSGGLEDQEATMVFTGKTAGLFQITGVKSFRVY